MTRLMRGTEQDDALGVSGDARDDCLSCGRWNGPDEEHRANALQRRVERFGHIVQVFSTYEARHDPADPKPFLRGINSLQLLFDGTRWWVVTIFWEAESESVKVPKEYLP